jgi:hypothetical protein
VAVGQSRALRSQAISCAAQRAVSEYSSRTHVRRPASRYRTPTRSHHVPLVGLCGGVHLVPPPLEGRLASSLKKEEPASQNDAARGHACWRVTRHKGQQARALELASRAHVQPLIGCQHRINPHWWVVGTAVLLRRARRRSARGRRGRAVVRGRHLIVRSPARASPVSGRLADRRDRPGCSCWARPVSIPAARSQHRSLSLLAELLCPRPFAAGRCSAGQAGRHVRSKPQAASSPRAPACSPRAACSLPTRSR